MWLDVGRSGYSLILYIRDDLGGLCIKHKVNFCSLWPNLVVFLSCLYCFNCLTH